MRHCTICVRSQKLRGHEQARYPRYRGAGWLSCHSKPLARCAQAMPGALHRLSGRGGPLIAFNGAGLSDTLADYQLFGNVAGSPNVGSAATPGLFGMAHGGTLFLDETARLSPTVQAKLLRALQSQGEYTRLGESKPRRADVLIIGAQPRARAARPSARPRAFRRPEAASGRTCG